jgi:hypothetical protein
MAEIDPLARLIGGLETKVDGMRTELGRHSDEDLRSITALRVEIREAIERATRELARRQEEMHAQNVAAIAELRQAHRLLADLPGEVAAMGAVLHGGEDGPGLVKAMRQVTAIFEGNRGRRAAWALLGTLVVALAGIASGIASVWHALFSR